MAALSVEGNYLKITRDGLSKYHPSQMLEVFTDDDNVIIHGAYDGFNSRYRLLDELYSTITGDKISGSTAEAVASSIATMVRETDVALQDQHTQAVITDFTNVIASSTTATLLAIEDTAIEVTDSTGMLVGHYLTLFSPTLNRFSTFHILAVDSETDILTVDTPLDAAYPAGTFVDAGEDNLAVNGSVTPVIFGIRNSTGSPVGLTVDITRIFITALTDNSVQLNEFADITALTNGMVLRKVDGNYYNIFNVKSNQDISALCYDLNITTVTGQGQEGFTARLTFGGQSKVGVVQRLAPGEDLQVIVQDNLTAIADFRIVAEGHIVD